MVADEGQYSEDSNLEDDDDNENELDETEDDDDGGEIDDLLEEALIDEPSTEQPILAKKEKTPEPVRIHCLLLSLSLNSIAFLVCSI